MIEWMRIPQFPNYEVNNYGDIRNIKTNRILKQFNRGNDYLAVNLGSGNLRNVHNIVARTFYHNDDESLIVHHIDGNKFNNALTNLALVSYSENNRHALQTGLRRPGSRFGIRKIVIIETGDVFPTLHSCARFINGDARHISDCLKGRRKTHRGYSFKYLEDFDDD